MLLTSTLVSDNNIIPTVLPGREVLLCLNHTQDRYYFHLPQPVLFYLHSCPNISLMWFVSVKLLGMDYQQIASISAKNHKNTVDQFKTRNP